MPQVAEAFIVCLQNAVFAFPTLVANLKDTIQDRDRVLAAWVEFHTGRGGPSIILL